MNFQNRLKTNYKIITLIFFLSLILLPSKPSWAEGEINKIGPFLRKAITETKGDASISLNSTEAEKKELIKVIVVMNCDHLSELSEKVIDQLKNRVEQLGGHIGDHAFNNVQAWLPVDKIEALAEWSEIRYIRKPMVPSTNSISSEGLPVIGASSCHNAGVTGSGVKVGILDLGFQGYSELLGTELPLHVETPYTGTVSDFLSTKHGTACAEIVHDVAPEAELFLINSADLEVDFPNAVSWLRSKGVSVISCSIALNLKLYAMYIYEALQYESQYALDRMTSLDDLKDQMNAAVSDAVQSGITWAQAAGNDGQRKWIGPFADTDFDYYHNFSYLSNENEIELLQNWTYGNDIYVILGWGFDDDSIGNDDFDLYITNQYGDIVDSSIITQSTFPLEVEACKITTSPGERYFISVLNWNALPQDISIIVGCDNFPALEHYISGGTVRLAPPASNPDAITVGAVPYYNSSTIEPFSSQGTGYDNVVKPDLVAPDGVSTESYGFDSFSGTSAAAPHVAGACALVKQVYPDWSPIQIKNYLEQNAIDLGVSGKDNVYGSGLVNLNGLIPFENLVYFPHIASNSTWETEICAINNSSESIVGVFRAYNDDGKSVSDPIEVTLGAHAREEIAVSDEFNDPSDIGYIIFKSDSENIVGYTKFYKDGQYRVAVPAVSEITSGDLYISHIASSKKWWTGVSVVNTESTAKNLIIEFDDGAIKKFSLAGYEHKAFSIKSLFDDTPQTNLHSAIIKDADGIVGLELFGSTYQLSGILLKNDTTTDMYYPHIASPKKWWTGIVAYNPSASSCTLTINPYTAEGTALTSQTVNLSGYEKYIGNTTTLGLPTNSAWFQIEATHPITGFELFGTSDSKLLAGYTGVNISSKEGVFAKIDKEGWAGIAFVNIGGSEAAVDLTAYNDTGNVINTESISLASHAKMVDNSEDIFDKNISNATYITYSSDQELVGFQLNGSSDSMMLDGLPGL